jgi:ATP-dependent Zn protease
MTKEPKSIRATAYHEAGHAVIAWRLDLKFRYATIKPCDDGTLGHVAFYRRRSDSRAKHTNRIVEGYAGQIAEAIYRGRRPLFGMHSDNQQAVNLVNDLYGSQETCEAYLHFCFLRARDLVTSDFGKIKDVAAALLERETLSYQDVEEVIMHGSTALCASGAGKTVK